MLGFGGHVAISYDVTMDPFLVIARTASFRTTIMTFLSSKSNTKLFQIGYWYSSTEWMVWITKLRFALSLDKRMESLNKTEKD